MAEEEQQADATEDADGDETEGAPKKRKLSGKMLILAVAVPVLLGGGGAAVWFSGLLDGGSAMEGEEVAEVKPAVFFEMPEMLVNLSNSDARRQYLKLQVALEMSSDETRDAIDPLLPRIMDIFQIYLRELRSEDLEGSAGVYRLKEELLRRINLVLNPHRIDEILFHEMLVQ